MDTGELLNLYFDRYSINSRVRHDFSHIAAMSDECRNDLINKLNRDISNDPIEPHEDAIGFRAEILASIYGNVIYYEVYENIMDEINYQKTQNERVLDDNIKLYNKNNQSGDTDFCNGNKLRNRMRLQEVKIRIDELSETPPVPIEQTKCYNIPTDEEIECHFQRALKLKEKIKTVGGKYLDEMVIDEIVKLLVSIFDGVGLDVKEQPSTITTNQQSPQTVQALQSTNHQSPTTN